MSFTEVFLLDSCKPKLKFLHFFAAKSKSDQSSFCSFKDRTCRYTDKTLIVHSFYKHHSKNV